MNRRCFLRSTLAALSAAATGSTLYALPFQSHVVADSKPLPPFPKDFLFGASTSSVQIEGASREDGKGESIWDRYASLPGKIADGSTPDVACDSYHRWRDDILLLKQMGLQSYRFSLAWPRILPQGKGAVNTKGLDHYSRLIDGLLAANIRPLVTAYHWDLPQALEDIGGWPSRDTANYFAEYVGLLARTYGDRVHHWGLMNEPQAGEDGVDDPDAFLDGVPYEAMNFKPGDETIMEAPLDYSGVNFYCGYEYFATGQKQELLRGLNAHAETPEA
jgi:beta-glucosidase/6-phospho-beta-glucosidase/beta-galactosidase